jgi:hypothetical protein
MGYELSIPLKVGTLEIEFDTVAELERSLARLDVARVERAVLAALHRDSRAPAKARKGRARKKGKKRA